MGTELLTREQAATYLGVAPQTLAVWACERRYALRYIKVGRLVRYRKSHLDAFLQRRTVHGAKPREGRKQNAVGADKRDA